MTIQQLQLNDNAGNALFYNNRGLGSRLHYKVERKNDVVTPPVIYSRRV